MSSVESSSAKSLDPCTIASGLLRGKRFCHYNLQPAVAQEYGILKDSYKRLFISSSVLRVRYMLTPLRLASRYGLLDKVMLLIRMGDNMNESDEDSLTSLYFITCYNICNRMAKCHRKFRLIAAEQKLGVDGDYDVKPVRRPSGGLQGAKWDSVVYFLTKAGAEIKPNYDYSLTSIHYAAMMEVLPSSKSVLIAIKNAFADDDEKLSFALVGNMDL
ncbi:unnamed protein product [Toxocara canis]|uniref:ANK_REP_REGION domain-containing protein n=1 Tax=Toxocara canis TaxID=6265 RepID=A0A183VAX6_TOXCA|nr:unnamed protein product [Toxocara canis]